MDKRTVLFIICTTLSFFGIQYWFGVQNAGERPAPQSAKAEVVAESAKRLETPLIAYDAPSVSSGEQFYVLENEYQQLVFSTLGGAISEINLPIRSSENQKSIVKTIDLDKEILKDSPQNGSFPLFPAEGATQSEGGYYPFLRRSQIAKDGSVAMRIDPKYYALNLIADDSGLANLSYRVTRFEKNLIRFEGSDGVRRIVKTFTIPQERNGPYCFTLDVQIDGNTQGVWLSSGVPEVELVSGSFSPLIRTQTTLGKSSEVETIDLTDKRPVSSSTSLTPNWISNSNGFFGIILDPLGNIGAGYRAEKVAGKSVPTRLSLIEGASDKYPGYVTYLPMTSGQPMSFRIIASPFDESLLKELDDFYDDPLDNYHPDYQDAQSIQGWFSFISQPFSKFLSLLLQMFYAVTHSWGFSIILLTIALRLMMYPLNNWSIRSTLKMQEIAPKIKAIQERHKKDPKKGQMEIMNLYRQQGINPFSGCFPILLQMPFLIGMFYLLKSTFPLRGASFIPGWIDNLAAPDVLFSWDTPIFLIGTQFHLLPILLGLTMFLQQKMTSKIPKDTKDLSDSQKQQKMMGNMMSIVFTVMFYGFPSGLNIYFISSTLLGILQQWFLTKKIKAEPPGPVLVTKNKK